MKPRWQSPCVLMCSGATCVNSAAAPLLDPVLLAGVACLSAHRAVRRRSSLRRRRLTLGCALGEQAAALCFSHSSPAPFCAPPSALALPSLLLPSPTKQAVLSSSPSMESQRGAYTPFGMHGTGVEAHSRSHLADLIGTRAVCTCQMHVASTHPHYSSKPTECRD